MRRIKKLMLVVGTIVCWSFVIAWVGMGTHWLDQSDIPNLWDIWGWACVLGASVGLAAYCTVEALEI